MKELVGEKPLGLDREFSDAGRFQAAAAEGVPSGVCLNLGSRPTLMDAEGHKLALALKPGERVCYRGVCYKGKAREQGRGRAEGLERAAGGIHHPGAGASLGDLPGVEETRKSLLGVEQLMSELLSEAQKIFS